MQTGAASATEVFVGRVVELTLKWAFLEHVFTHFSVQTDFAHMRPDLAVLCGTRARRRLRSAHATRAIQIKYKSVPPF